MTSCSMPMIYSVGGLQWTEFIRVKKVLDKDVQAALQPCVVAEQITLLGVACLLLTGNNVVYGDQVWRFQVPGGDNCFRLGN